MFYRCNKSLTRIVSDSTADCQHFFDDYISMLTNQPHLTVSSTSNYPATTPVPSDTVTMGMDNKYTKAASKAYSCGCVGPPKHWIQLVIPKTSKPKKQMAAIGMLCCTLQPCTALVQSSQPCFVTYYPVIQHYYHNTSAYTEHMYTERQI